MLPELQWGHNFFVMEIVWTEAKSVLDWYASMGP